MEIKIDANFFQIDARPRYVEDAKVNGTYEYKEEYIIDGYQPKMPLMVKKTDGWHWIITIDLDTGMILRWPKGTTAKTYYKVCDDGCYTLVYNGYRTIQHQDVYVPSILDITGKSYGDYLEFEIDTDGYIKNFPKGEELTEKIINFIER